MLIDDVTITLKAGSGGNGSVHFKRNAQTAKGGPDGGNGGKGGDIYIRGTSDITALAQFQYKKTISAPDGEGGSGKNLFGRGGKDIEILLPEGTHITDLDSNESWEVMSVSSRFLIASGGKGGRGNNEFKTATNQTPTYAEKGEAGQTRTVQLLLKLIADIGLIGLPNAGKSSLLSILTNAKPKIGDYPFTTLNPNLGVLTHGDTSKRVIIADIPGVIEGASKGKGLGVQFLKHIEKTRILFHCIDCTTPDPIDAYQTIRTELSAFSTDLAQKEEVILLTKRDLISSDQLERVRDALASTQRHILSVSLYDPTTPDVISETMHRMLSETHPHDG
jgi:GTP-binding protein